MTAKYTEHLLAKHSADFSEATNHPFLAAAGDGTLEKDVLERWLRQDYLYAHVGYIKYASLLLSRLPYPTLPPSGSSSARDQTLYKAISVLIFSLQNVRRETRFFASTAAEFGLDLFPGGQLAPVTKTGSEEAGDGLLGEYEGVTRSYVDFLHATAATGSVEEGLVVLWVMEKAYLEAWRYAKSQRSPVSSMDQPKTRTQEALVHFIDNWTCDEFVGFVDDCEELVDGLLKQGDEVAARCEEAFKRILWLEQRFWPTMSA